MSSEKSVCPACGFAAPSEGRFCSHCGHELDGALAPRRLYGVLAPGPTFVLACLLLLGAVLALIVGSPVAASVLVAFSGATFVLFYGAAERDPASQIARAVLTCGRRARGWAAFGRESVAAWASAARDVAKLRREARSLRHERQRMLLALGEASYSEDLATMGALRLRLQEIDERLTDRERAQAATLAKARRHVDEERVAVSPTQQFSVEDLASGGDAEK